MREAKCGFTDGQAGSGQYLLVAHGPTLFVDIGFDPAFDPQIVSNPPRLAATKLQALVDTGATESCIDSDLATKLQLPIVDRRGVSGVSGLRMVDMHLGHIHIPALGFTLYGAFAGVDLIAGGQHHFALLGRTFLSNFTMAYNGATGDVTISSQG